MCFVTQQPQKDVSLTLSYTYSIVYCVFDCLTIASRGHVILTWGHVQEQIDSELVPYKLPDGEVVQVRLHRCLALALFPCG